MVTTMRCRPALAAAALCLSAANVALAQQADFPSLIGGPESERVTKAFADARLIETLDFQASDIELEHINAVVRILPENRDDIAVDFYGGPMPEFSVRGNKLTVDGGLENDKGNGWGWNTKDWCDRRKEEDERSVMLIRVPRTLDVSMDGAIDASVGATEGGSLSVYGCGHTDVGAIDGDFAANAGNSTSLSIVSIGGNAALQAMNSSDMAVGAIGGDLSAKTMNSSEMELQSVDGDATLETFNSADTSLTTIIGDAMINVYNSADLKIESIGGSVKAKIMNSADLDISEVGENFSVDIMNSGGSDIDTLGGNLKASLNNGSGLKIKMLTAARTADLDLNHGASIKIDGGQIEELDLRLYRGAKLNFGGRVERASIRMDSDQDSYIEEAVTVSLEKDRNADGEVRFGKVTNLTQ